MQMKIEMTKRKSRQIQFRCDGAFEDEINDWLEIHPQYDMSKLIRKSIEEKIHKDGSLSKEINPLETLIIKKFDELTKKIDIDIEKAITKQVRGGKRGIEEFTKLMDTNRKGTTTKETKTSND